MSEETRKFISTGGGPFIAVGAGNRNEWEGTNKPSHGRIVEATFRWAGAGTVATDYDRACDISTYLGVINICSESGVADALIFGEDPNMLSLWTVDGRLPYLLGWNYANSDEEFEAALSTLSADSIATFRWHEAPIEFSVTSRPLYVFDSAYEGEDIEQIKENNYLLFDLPLGKYRAGVCLFEPNTETSILIYRFEAI